MQLPIETHRLRLTEFADSDAETLFLLRSDPEVARFQGWIPEDLKAAQDFLRRNAESDLSRAGNWLQLAIRTSSDGALIGDVGLHRLDGELKQVEIGFSVARAHHRRGNAAEAVSAVLDTLFRDLGQHRVTASVDPRNEASMALLPKLGFRQEAHHRRSLWFKGEWVDDVVFAMLAEEWHAKRER